MAFTCFENFDSYPDGSIANRSGGDGWAPCTGGWTGVWQIGAGTWAVQGTTVKGGSKALSVTRSGMDWMYRGFTNTTVGILDVWMRKDSNSSGKAMLVICENTSSKGIILFETDGKVYGYNNASGGYQEVATYVADTWYKVSIEIDKTNQANNYRVRLNDGVWSSWKQVSDGSYGNINGLIFQMYDSAGTLYVDSISPSPAPSPIVIDSYGTNNYAATTTLNVGSALVSYGQTFTSGISGKLDSCKFYAFKTSGATGDMYAKLWSISGTHGTDGVPDTLLGTSDALDASTLGTSIGIVTFSFSGANRADITAGTNYVITLDYSGATSIFVARDNSSPSHPGNSVSKVWNSGSYGYNTANDVIFYAYGVTSVAYTLAAAYTTFTETAYAALLKLGWKIAAAYSSFSLTGQNSILGWGRKIAAAVGTFALTGFNTILFKGKQLVAEVANFVLTGEDSLFHIALNLLTATGNYTLTGIESLFHFGKQMVAAMGEFTLTGLDVILGIGKGMVAAVGEFVLTGQAATFNFGKRLIAAVGSFVETGYAARLLVNGYRNIWSWATKHTTTYTNRAKNDTSWTHRNKS